MINQPIRNVIINRKQEQHRPQEVHSRSQPRVPPPTLISQQLQSNDNDDIDYDDIIEVESDLLDNSFIDDVEDDEDEENYGDEEIIEDYGHFDSNFKQPNTRRGFIFNDQINTESEYENMSSNINSNNNNNNNNNVMYSSSSSHYKSSSSSSSCQKGPPQISTNMQPNHNRFINSNNRVSLPNAELSFELRTSLLKNWFQVLKI